MFYLPSQQIYLRFLTNKITNRMSFEPKQMEMICLDDLVPQNHIYRKFLALWDLSKTELELEKFLRENTASKLFCRFSLTDKTTDHNAFTRAREKIGTQKLSQIFASLRNQLKSRGYVSEVFTFVDATKNMSPSTCNQD